MKTSQLFEEYTTEYMLSLDEFDGSVEMIDKLSTTPKESEITNENKRNKILNQISFLKSNILKKTVK